LHGGASDLVHCTAAERRLFGEESSALLAAILAAGRAALASGASALDVVEAAVCAMEDSGLLNAGRGSTRDSNGGVQTDAAIMDGRELRAGAVAALGRVRNPVAVARLVMERSAHVMLAGPDATRFAEASGARMVDADYFESSPVRPGADDTDTVGAVALDRAGDLAAATSTGGVAGKLPGRVGDSPVIGAGTYADNTVAAVSCTGQGEYFMRLVLAHEVVALVRHARAGLAEAVAQVIDGRLGPSGGQGGLIAVSPAGEVVMRTNTAFMPRGFVTRESGPRVLFHAG
jgi:isoaspartyl peptidase/L-asparaginase-like protein (Ntn-hydrolase superfamily)